MPRPHEAVEDLRVQPVGSLVLYSGSPLVVAVRQFIMQETFGVERGIAGKLQYKGHVLDSSRGASRYVGEQALRRNDFNPTIPDASGTVHRIFSPNGSVPGLDVGITRADACAGSPRGSIRAEHGYVAV